jgi:hypothetical protein
MRIVSESNSGMNFGKASDPAEIADDAPLQLDPFFNHNPIQ